MGFRAAFYRGTRPGVAGVYSRGVRLVDRGPYSHCELIFSDGMAASASWMDGGVRFKRIDFDPEHWDFIDIPQEKEALARQWFEKHKGRELNIKTITANTVVSASSNVAPLTSATAGTAILAATAGKWARLVSDGTNWRIMSGS